MTDSTERPPVGWKQACSTAVYATSPLPDALKAIAQTGFRFVDLLAIEGWAHVAPSWVKDDPGLAEETAELIKKAGLKCVAINGGFGEPSNTFDASAHAENMELFRALAQLAAACGASVITLSAGPFADQQTTEASIAQTIANFRDLGGVAKQNDVCLSIETHSGSVAERPQDLVRIMKTVPGLMVTLDPSHLIAMGIDLSEVERLMKYTVHVHLRNAVSGNFQAPMDKGLLDFDRFLNILRSHGYEGYISTEYIAAPKYPYDVVAEALKLKDLLHAFSSS